MLEQGKTWPISNVTPDEVNTALQAAKEEGSKTTEITEVTQGTHQAPTEAIGSGATTEEKPKRKRSRSRKRKSSGSSSSDKSGEAKTENSAPSVSDSSQQKESSDSGLLSIR